MRTRLRNILTALALTAATGLILTGPAQPAAASRPPCKPVYLRADGPNGSKLLAWVVYCGDVARCATVTELKPGTGPAAVIANSCTPPIRR